MRLIDADELVFTTCGSEWCNQNKRYCNTCPSAITTRNRIENVPTVEPENLIKPIASIKVEISEEEKQMIIEELRKERLTPWEYNFCPNCGAEMRKGGKDNGKS